MDDELPLVIFVICHMSPTVNIQYEIKLIEDYLKIKTDLDFEEKYFRNFSVA